MSVKVFTGGAAVQVVDTFVPPVQQQPPPTFTQSPDHVTQNLWGAGLIDKFGDKWRLSPSGGEGSGARLLTTKLGTTTEIRAARPPVPPETQPVGAAAAIIELKDGICWGQRNDGTWFSVVALPTISTTSGLVITENGTVGPFDVAPPATVPPTDNPSPVPVGPFSSSKNPNVSFATPALMAADVGTTAGITGIFRAGRYLNVAAQFLAPDFTIVNPDNAPAIFDALGQAQAANKGVLVLSGDRVKLRGLIEVLHAPRGDGACSGIRIEGDTWWLDGLTPNGLSVHDCYGTGIMTANNKPNSRGSLKNAWLLRNGGGDGQSHNLYGGAELYLEIIDVNSDDCYVGHSYKTRAAKLYMRRAHSIQGRGSRYLDYSWAGDGDVDECTIYRDSRTGNNRGIVGYGYELPTNQPKYAVNQFIFGAANKIGDALGDAILFGGNITPAPKTIAVYQTIPALPPAVPPPAPTVVVNPLVVPEFGPDGQVKPEWIASLPLKVAVEIDGTRADALVALLPPGFKDYGVEGFAALEDDWSSGDYDQETGEWAGSGGAHGGSSNNAVIRFKSRTMKWDFMMAPSVITQAIADLAKTVWNKTQSLWVGWSQGVDKDGNPSDEWPDDKMSAAHTYDEHAWVKVNGQRKLYRWGNMHNWLIDAVTGACTKISTLLPGRGWVSSMTTIRDPQTNLIYNCGKMGYGYWDIVAVDPATGAQTIKPPLSPTTLAPVPSPGHDAVFCWPANIELIGRKLLCYKSDNGRAWTIDLDTWKQTELVLSNGGFLTDKAMWGSCTDGNVMYLVRASGKICSIAMDGTCVEDIGVTLGLPSAVAAVVNGIYGRFYYDALWKMFFIHVGTSRNVIGIRVG